jgi:hypothetical protein
MGSFVESFEAKKLAACARGIRGDTPSWVINPWPHHSIPLSLGHSEAGMIWTNTPNHTHKHTMTPPWPLKQAPVTVEVDLEELLQEAGMPDGPAEEEEEEAEPRQEEGW